MTLDEFKRVSAGDRPGCFSRLSLADQLAFVREAEPFELILGGYPSESSLLAAVESLTEKGGCNENPTLH